MIPLELPDFSAELPRIRQILSETMAWCSTHATAENPETSTRTPELKPPASLDRYEGVTSFADRRKSFDEVCLSRARELARSSTPLPTVTSDLGGGRLLLCDVDCTDWSELSEEASRGFFDIRCSRLGYLVSPFPPRGESRRQPAVLGSATAAGLDPGSNQYQSRRLHSVG